MTAKWPEVALGEVLDHVARPVDVIADVEYRQIGIRSHGRGIFHKEPVTGLQLGEKRVFWVEPGDFVLNIVFAWEGAVAVVGSNDAGMIGSHRFPTFRADPSRLEAVFLLWYFRTPRGIELLGRVSPGGAGRNRTLSRAAFLEQSVPLPPLAEQRRIVAKLEHLAPKVEEARQLCRKTHEESAAFLRSVLTHMLSTTTYSGTLGEVLMERPRNGWSARCDNSDTGVAVLTLSAVTGFHYGEMAFKRTSEPTNPNGHYWLKTGDLLITRSNTPELVGQVAIYNGKPNPCIYPDLMMRLSVNPCVADPSFVWSWLQTPVVRNFITLRAKGTSPTMKKISQEVVMSIPFPAGLSLLRQQEIVSSLHSLGAFSSMVRETQQQVGAELSVLMPAILDRAFRGEL